MLTHEQIIALRERGVRVDNIFIPGLAAIEGQFNRAYGEFISSIESDDQIVSDMEIGVDSNTDDETIVDQIENKAAAGKLAGLIVELACGNWADERNTTIYVEGDLFTAIDSAAKELGF
ncbi:hypothetical protein KEU06_08705 [Pseudaminobacter sp. 19-2017]|uniref:Uncharacterized protein n=1 Tax=Pseudaminobacter soli (ex Zhang et al. 2022) TaxID=2831468 RepID=A0A942I1X7_9HYPH|nr:hypothetical protein [Pseudaminobacter soli]MBS3648707.1 hypothetical protein [Pseudaminobacter soli]